MSAESLVVRQFEQADHRLLAEITQLLHRGYAPLAASGMRFYASHQDEAATLERLTKGVGLLAFLDERLVGTVTAYLPGQKTDGAAWYARPDVAQFGQLTVDPEMQGHGFGRRLLECVEELASESGAREIACDTSMNATALIALYQRRGFRIVGEVQWDVTNYRSVILSKRLGAR